MLPHLGAWNRRKRSFLHDDPDRVKFLELLTGGLNYAGIVAPLQGKPAFERS
jgi:hypothetical protein